MNLVPRRSRISYSTFKKLPNGSAYFLASDSTGPFVKLGAHTRVMADTLPQVDPVQTAVTDNSVAVIKLDPFFKREQS